MSKWIKCSDRMPEDETDVLVAVYGTDTLTVEDDSFESLQKLKLPSGEMKELNLYFKETKDSFISIGEAEYKEREREYLANRSEKK